MDEMKKFAEEVKARRRAAGLSREMLSDLTSVSVSTLNRIEWGITSRSVHQATRAALEGTLGPLPPTPVSADSGPKKRDRTGRANNLLAVLRTARAEALAEVAAAKASLAKAESMLARLDAAIAALGGG